MTCIAQHPGPIADATAFSYNHVRPISSVMAQPAPRSVRNDRLLTWGVLVAAVAMALAIRILWPYDTVFVDGNVWFREMDAWYHMRLVDSFVHNFPYVTSFDPYSFFPYGIRSTFHPLTTWLIGVPAMLLGGGHPSAALIDVCGAYFPPVLGALTVVPVYFIGRHLYGRVAGATAALLIAILPGEFLSRSLLGFTDHHVTEAFFSTLTLLFLMIALRQARDAEVVIRRPADVLGPAYRRALLWAVIAGVCLGLYLLAWRGGVLLLAILVLYMVIRCVSDYRRGSSLDDLVLIFPVAGAIALLMAAPVIAAEPMTILYAMAMISVVVAPVVLRFLTAWGKRLGLSRWAFVGALGGFLALAFMALVLIFPVLAQYVRDAIDFMVPTGAHLSIMEMHPLFFPSGVFSVTVAWNNFTTALGVFIIALVVILRSPRRARGNDVTLLLVWSLAMLGAVLLQRRFGYYFAIDVAILCGFLVGWVFGHPYLQHQMELLHRRAGIPSKSKTKSATRALQSHNAVRRAAMLKIGAVGVGIVAILGVPSLQMARNFATEPGLMTAGWYETLTWLRDNTPEPLDADAYYQLFEVPPDGESFPYPSTAYGIMSWWDFGHWITRLSHRIPESNPFQQGARTAARFFTAQSEVDGAAVLDNCGCTYVVVDSRTAVTAFSGVVGWTGHQLSEYYEAYQQRNSDGVWEPIVLYYPEYYQTMAVRLYTFHGQATEPEEYSVIRFQMGESSGHLAKEIVELQQFHTYDEALSFLSQSGDANWRLVSADPLTSAAPLEALHDFSVEHESAVEVFLQGQPVSEVRVFKYAGDNG